MPPAIGDKVVYRRAEWMDPNNPDHAEWRRRAEQASIVVSVEGLEVTCWSSWDSDTWVGRAENLRVVERASYLPGGTRREEQFAVRDHKLREIFDMDSVEHAREWVSRVADGDEEVARSYEIVRRDLWVGSWVPVPEEAGLWTPCSGCGMRFADTLEEAQRLR